MKAILTIAEREIRSYFMSPIGFVVLAAFLVMGGWRLLAGLVRDLALAVMGR